MQVCSRPVLVEIGINALGYREVLGMPWPTAKPRASGGISSAGSSSAAWMAQFLQPDWRRTSINPLEQLNIASGAALGDAVIKRRVNVVGIIPNDDGIVRLVGSYLLKQQEEWLLERRRVFSEATMTKIPELEEALELTDGFVCPALRNIS